MSEDGRRGQVIWPAPACVPRPGRALRQRLSRDPPPGQAKLIGADASHAWFALYHPGLGWFDFDTTNNHCPDNRHITFASGRDYGDVPLKGVVYGEGSSTNPALNDLLPEYEFDQRVGG